MTFDFLAYLNSMIGLFLLLLEKQDSYLALISPHCPTGFSARRTFSNKKINVTVLKIHLFKIQFYIMGDFIQFICSVHAVFRFILLFKHF